MVNSIQSSDEAKNWGKTTELDRNCGVSEKNGQEMAAGALGRQGFLTETGWEVGRWQDGGSGDISSFLGRGTAAGVCGKGRARGQDERIYTGRINKQERRRRKWP